MDDIIIRDLSVGYDGGIVLKDVNLVIKREEITVVLGPNGAGKTTLLKTILGLIKPLRGEVKVFGYDPFKEGDKVRQMIGYLPQLEKYSYEISIPVIEVVLMSLLIGRKFPRLPRKEDVEKALNCLEKAGVRDIAYKSFNELSGGQRQRVLLARALVKEPKYLFLDEPFTGVDVKGQREIINCLLDIKENDGVGMFIILHDIAPLAPHIDKLILVNKEIIAAGKPIEILTPENLRRTYGVEMPIITQGDVCYPLIGDRHV